MNKANFQVGKKIDIAGLVDIFEAQEGDVEHIIGKTGQGKTYEATRRALKFLQKGNVVYTTWRLNLPDSFDERESPWHVLKKILTFRKRFYKFNYKKNWHFVNLDDYIILEGKNKGVFDTEKFAIFLASVTDAIFMLDEGQDVFDSHQRAGKIARQSITRTRHMHKKLVIISQRAQAVEVTARGNVTWFYKCEATHYPLLPTFFRVYRTDEIDEANNHPIWVRHNSVGDVVWKAEVYHSSFARKKIYDAYDSWYMRKNMIKSQEVHLEGYELKMREKIRLFWRLLKNGNPLFKKVNTSYPQVIHTPPINPTKEPLSKKLAVVSLNHDKLIGPKPVVSRRTKKRQTDAQVFQTLPKKFESIEGEKEKGAILEQKAIYN